MSNFSRRSYEQATQTFFTQNPTLAERYLSPTLLETVTNAMLTSLPTVTAAKIAFDKLVANGTLTRTDGRDERFDAQQAATEAQANRDKIAARIDAPPLTRDELLYFGSLGQRELVERYWSNNEFRVRYDKAHREHGFVIPPKFAESSATPAVDSDLVLTAAQYHSIPAHELQIKLRDPKFKLAVMMLIKNHEI